MRAAYLFALVYITVGSPICAATLPESVSPDYYAYDDTLPTFSKSPYSDQLGIPVTRVTFPSADPSKYSKDNTVIAYLFHGSGDGPHPGMVVLHEWNAASPKFAFQLCAGIAKAGVDALMVEEPFSLERRPVNPHPPDAEILSGNVPVMVASLHQAVIDARRGLDYLASRPDIDPNRLGISGISLGGVLSGIVAGVDPRVKVVLTIVAGADFAKGFWNGLLTRRFRGAIERSGYSYKTFADAVSPFEAANWERGFNGHNALMFNGRYDLVIFPDQARTLSKVLGNAPIVWANTGHYGLVLSANSTVKLAHRFLRAAFFNEDLPFQPPASVNATTFKIGLLVGGQEGLSPVAAVQMFNFDTEGKASIDGQLSLHGVAGALSVRLNPVVSLGLELPIGHGTVKPRPFAMFSLTL